MCCQRNQVVLDWGISWGLTLYYHCANSGLTEGCVEVQTWTFDGEEFRMSSTWHMGPEEEVENQVIHRCE